MPAWDNYILRTICSTRLIFAILLILPVIAFPVLAGPGIAGSGNSPATVPDAITITPEPVTDPGSVESPVPANATATPDGLTIVVRDAGTLQKLGDARIYLDGGYRGDTSSSEGAGILAIPDIRPGTHTVRVTRTGYKEITRKFMSPGEPTVVVDLAAGALVSLNPDGTRAEAINVIFYPSSTSYSCKDHTKIPAPEYLENETRFRSDVQNVINKTYLELDQVTSPANPLPSDYRKNFNFYYYYDPAFPADAFSGCAGKVPEQYWNEVPFSDITVILYPGYSRISADSTCQPTGGFQDYGPGRALMKAPADQMGLVRHETGHAVFGLIDTYCGTTYYRQNDPNPNVWSSSDSCRADAVINHRDPDQCR
jgi:hypothetical protein